MPVYVTYQKGTKDLFVAAKQVLSPPGVEGVSLPSLEVQVHDKGKRPIHDEGPSGEQETNFILIQDDDTDLGSPSSKFREIIQEQKAEINNLSLKLQRAQ